LLYFFNYTIYAADLDFMRLVSALIFVAGSVCGFFRQRGT
jgi:hypothetical protein